MTFTLTSGLHGWVTTTCDRCGDTQRSRFGPVIRGWQREHECGQIPGQSAIEIGGEEG